MPPRKKEIEKAIAVFHEAFGPAQSYRPFAPADAERLGDRLHPTFKALAETDGWASYADQSLWLCDPDDWKGVAGPWMEEGTKIADVVFRSGFGDLIVWDGTNFWLVMPHDAVRMRYALRDDFLIQYSLIRPASYFNASLPDMMERGRKEAGPLGHDTMDTYVPALALGGDEKDSKIEVVKAHEGLSILEQLAPIETLGLGAR